jgi:hypothetical protein
VADNAKLGTTISDLAREMKGFKASLDKTSKGSSLQEKIGKRLREELEKLSNANGLFAKEARDVLAVMDPYTHAFTDAGAAFDRFLGAIETSKIDQLREAIRLTKTELEEWEVPISLINIQKFFEGAYADAQAFSAILGGLIRAINVAGTGFSNMWNEFVGGLERAEGVWNRFSDKWDKYYESLESKSAQAAENMVRHLMRATEGLDFKKVSVEQFAEFLIQSKVAGEYVQDVVDAYATLQAEAKRSGIAGTRAFKDTGDAAGEAVDEIKEGIKGVESTTKALKTMEAQAKKSYSEASSNAKKYADLVKKLTDEIKNFNIDAEQEIADLKRVGMSDYEKYKDREKEIARNLAKFKEAYASKDYDTAKTYYSRLVSLIKANAVEIKSDVEGQKPIIELEVARDKAIKQLEFLQKEMLEKVLKPQKKAAEELAKKWSEAAKKLGAEVKSLAREIKKLNEEGIRLKIALDEASKKETERGVEDIYALMDKPLEFKITLTGVGALAKELARIATGKVKVPAVVDKDKLAKSAEDAGREAGQKVEE